jgi:poly(3-hydroxybutyrate) depolymerase
MNKNACTLSASPYLSDCNYDGAGIALAHIAGKALNARNAGTLTGSLLTFDQTEFITGKSMDTTGYAFVPASCAAGEACTMHISFHGCEQGASSVGTAYVNGAGFNKWADTNSMIVLYPQVSNKIQIHVER